VLYKGRLKASGYQSAAELERFSGDTAQEQGYLSASRYLLVGRPQRAVAQASGRRIRPVRRPREVNEIQVET
jgi:hypothetical protein